MKTRASILITSIFLSAVSGFASASPDRDMEVISIQGDQSLAQLRHAIKVKRFEFYEAYNAVNTKPAFDILCSVETLPGSHIKEQTCEARYVKLVRQQFIQDNTSGMSLNISRIANQNNLTPYLKPKDAEAEVHMSEVISQHAEVADKWNDLVITMSRYFKKKSALDELN